VETLTSWAAAAIGRLPTVEGEELVLTGAVTGRPPAELTTDGLVLRGRWPGHTYHDTATGAETRCDGIDFFAENPAYQALGLLLFAALFHQSTTAVRLTRAADRHLNGRPIQRLVVDATPGRPDPGPDELVTIPSAYGYWPSPIDGRHPLAGCVADPWSTMPTLAWSNDEQMLVSDRDWETRDVVYGFGSALGTARLAAVLLDFGRSENDRTEFDLEGPVGAWSVTPQSAEARFHIGYEYKL
jgi:hypothetical protein